MEEADGSGSKQLLITIYLSQLIEAVKGLSEDDYRLLLMSRESTRSSVTSQQLSEQSKTSTSMLEKPMSDSLSGGKPSVLEVSNTPMAFTILKRHVEEAHLVLGKLGKAMEGMDLSKSDVFESKTQFDDLEGQKKSVTENRSPAADPSALMREHMGDLKEVLNKIASDADNASLSHEAEQEIGRDGNVRTELRLQFEALEQHTLLLEAANIELGVLCEATKLHALDVNEKNREVECLYETLKQEASDLKASNAELGVNLSVYESKVLELQNQLDDLQTRSNGLVSQLSSQLDTLQTEASDRALKVEQEWASTISQMIEAVQRLDKTIGIPATWISVSAGSFGSFSGHATSSIDAAIKIIRDLKGKLEAVSSDHESTFNLHEESNKKHNECTDSFGSFSGHATSPSPAIVDSLDATVAKHKDPAEQEKMETILSPGSIYLLYEACSSSLLEIENSKAAEVTEGWPVEDQGLNFKSATTSVGQSKFPSDTDVKNMAQKLLLSVRSFCNIKGKMLEGDKKEMKATILNLQELQEKEIQRESAKDQAHMQALSELEGLRVAAQNTETLLQAERRKVDELAHRVESLEKSLHEREAQLNMLGVDGDSSLKTSANSEIVEVEPLINKWTVSRTEVVDQWTTMVIETLLADGANKDDAMAFGDNTIDSLEPNDRQIVHASLSTVMVDSLDATTVATEMESASQENEESLPSQEDIPDVSLIYASGDQEADGLGLKQHNGSHAVVLEEDGRVAVSEPGESAKSAESKALERMSTEITASQVKQDDGAGGEFASIGDQFISGREILIEMAHICHARHKKIGETETAAPVGVQDPGVPLDYTRVSDDDGHEQEILDSISRLQRLVAESRTFDAAIEISKQRHHPDFFVLLDCYLDIILSDVTSVSIIRILTVDLAVDLPKHFISTFVTRCISHCIDIPDLNKRISFVNDIRGILMQWINMRLVDDSCVLEDIAPFLTERPCD